MLSVIIIAAGKATRLGSYSKDVPKQLLEVAPNTSIIDIILNHLEELGLDDITLVVRADHYNTFKDRLKDNIKIVSIEEDEFENLFSLKKGLEYVGVKRILLLVSDHVFEVSMLKRLLASREDKDLILCLDRKPRYVDVNEGLKVKIDDGKVKMVDKALESFDGIDTGLFILSPYACNKVYDFIYKNGKCSTIASFINELANEDRVGYVDVSGMVWKDIDTIDDLKHAKCLYWEIVRRSLYKDSDGVVARYLNRPLSTRLSILIVKHTNITPNIITLISSLIGFLAAFLFYQHMLIPAALLVHASSVLDGVDGEVARLRKQSSEFGGLLDSTIDRFVDLAIIIAIGLNLELTEFNLAIVASAAFGIILVSYLSHLSKDPKVRQGFPYATRDVRLFLITIGGLIDQLLIALIFCSIAPMIFAGKVLSRSRLDVMHSN